MKKTFKLIALSGALAINGCGGTGGDNTTNGTKNLNTQKKIYLDSLGVVPLSTSQDQGQFLFRVHNETDKNYYLDSISVLDANNKQRSDLLAVSTESCKRIFANSNCNIAIRPKTNKSSDILMIIKLRSNDNEVQTLRQLVRMSDRVTNKDGIIAENDLNVIASIDGEYGVALPFILDKSSDALRVENGSVICGDDYIAGAACTALIGGKAASQKTIVSTRIVGRNKDVEFSYPSSLIIDQGSTANLLTSYGVLVEDGKQGDILIQNTGNVAAKVAVTPNNPDNITILSGKSSNLSLTKNELSTDLADKKISECQDIIEAGDICKLSLLGKSIYSVPDTLNVSYSYDNGQTSISTKKEPQVYLIGNTEEPSLEIEKVGEGNLLNTLVNSKKTETYTIKNLQKARPLISLVVSLQVNHDDITIEDSTCNNFVQNDQSCSIKVSYYPKKAPDRDINTSALVFINGYYDNKDKITKQIRSSISVRYSTFPKNTPGMVINNERDNGLVETLWAAGVATNESHEHRIRLRNSASSVADPSNNISFKQFTLSDPKFKVSKKSTCTLTQQLNPGQECEVVIVPSASQVTPFEKNTFTLETKYSQFNYEYDSPIPFVVEAKTYAPIIEADLLENDQSLDDTTTLGVKEKNFKYILTNTGTFPANNLNIQFSSQLDSNFVINSRCPQVLAIGESCEVGLSYSFKNPTFQNSKEISLGNQDTLGDNGDFTLNAEYYGNNIEEKNKQTKVFFQNKKYKINRNYLNLNKVEESQIKIAINSDNSSEVILPITLKQSVTEETNILVKVSNNEVGNCLIVVGSNKCEVSFKLGAESVGYMDKVLVDIYASTENLPAVHGSVSIIPLVVYFSKSLPKVIFDPRQADTDAFSFVNQYKGYSVYEAGTKVEFEITHSNGASIPNSEVLVALGSDIIKNDEDAAAEFGEIALSPNLSCLDKLCRKTGVITIKNQADTIGKGMSIAKRVLFTINAVVTINGIRTDRQLKLNADNYLIVKSLNINTSDKPLSWSSIKEEYPKNTGFFPVKAGDIIDEYGSTNYEQNNAIKNTRYLATLMKVNAWYTDVTGNTKEEKSIVNLFGMRNSGGRSYCMLREKGCEETNNPNRPTKIQIGTYAEKINLDGGNRDLEGYTIGDQILPFNVIQKNDSYEIDLSKVAEVKKEIDFNKALPNGNYKADLYLLTSNNFDPSSGSELVNVKLNWDKKSPK